MDMAVRTMDHVGGKGSRFNSTVVKVNRCRFKKGAIVIVAVSRNDWSTSVFSGSVNKVIEKELRCGRKSAGGKTVTINSKGYEKLSDCR